MMIYFSDAEIRRFWSSVDMIPENRHACWEWMKSTTGNRDLGWYGAFNRGRKEVREFGGARFWYAHRAAYLISRGLPLEYLTTKTAIIHSCDNPLCCNPYHLDIALQMMNVEDMMKKGRHWRQRRKPAA